MDRASIQPPKKIEHVAESHSRAVDSAITRARSVVDLAAGIEPDDITVPVPTDGDKKTAERVNCWEQAQINFDELCNTKPFDFEIKNGIKNVRDKALWDEVD